MHKFLDRVFVLFVAFASCLAPAQASAETFDWKLVEPSTVGLDRAPLDKLAERITADLEFNIHSVLVVKDGELAFEEYFSGPDQDWGTDLGNVQFDSSTRHDLRSVSKSVTSALIGIAIADGKLPGTDATVPEMFPEYADHIAPDKRALTLEHLLTMTAGLSWFEPIDYTNPGNDEIRMINSPDPVAFVLGRSFATMPGERFQYNGGLPTLLGYLLEKAYGKRGDVIAREILFEPLGIDDFDFRANRNGLLAYASGMRLTPRDIARIGLLYLNEGEWEDGDLTVRTARMRHNDFTVGYRIETPTAQIVYIPDNELVGGPFPTPPDWRQKIQAFVSGADLLIHDGMFTEEEYVDRAGWGHSTFAQALELAVKGSVKHLHFFHHSPERSDDDLDRILEKMKEAALARSGDLTVEAAAEGMNLSLG